jgi:WD40 repeat protein
VAFKDRSSFSSDTSSLCVAKPGWFALYRHGLLSTAGTARLWDTDAMVCHAVLEGHSAAVNSIAFDGSGEQCVTASDDRTAKLWFIRTAAASVGGMRGAPTKGTTITTTTPSSPAPHPHNATNPLQKCKFTLKGHNRPVTCASFVPTKRGATVTDFRATLLVTGSEDFTVRLHL